MRPALPLLALILAAAASAQAQQPTPPPVAPREAVRGLFGGPEPQDEEEAAARSQPAPASPTAPPSAPTSEAYSDRVRQSFAAAQFLQGRLDGGWIVSSGGLDLLHLQLVDKGKGEVEGAWRDPREGSAVTASGLLDPTPVTNGGLDVAFGPPGRGEPHAYRLTVRPTGDTQLAGKLRVYDEIFDVTMRRAR